MIICPSVATELRMDVRAPNDERSPAHRTGAIERTEVYSSPTRAGSTMSDS